VGRWSAAPQRTAGKSLCSVRPCMLGMLAYAPYHSSHFYSPVAMQCCVQRYKYLCASVFPVEIIISRYDKPGLKKPWVYRFGYYIPIPMPVKPLRLFFFVY
jgi:hypothetical protein